MTSLPSILAACLGTVLLAATPGAPVPTCDDCGMWIEQPRFGGRMPTLDRQSLRFDATECWDQVVALVREKWFEPARR